MKREVLITADGSATIAIPDMHVTYHSVHGALQESMHVFIQAGLAYFLSERSVKKVRILEMGLGTGLNALLTIEAIRNRDTSIEYHALEAFPLDIEEMKELHYDLPHFSTIHSADWNGPVAITDQFILHKHHTDIQNFSSDEKFDLVYYDAFAPSAQPELWTTAIFKKIHDMMSTGGILVTYCSKGDVRRAMIAAGFQVEKLPGPKGKREMLRATRT